uniref:3'-5' exonuclease domain-containing protein n=1 Tax=Acrobeloides nanus TaxID=290746 RepID=A0A914C4Y7_9BILA
MKICLPHFRKFTLEFYRPCSTTNNPGPSVTPKEQDSEKEYAERVLKYAKASLSHTFEDYYQKKRCKLEHVEDMIQTSLMQKPELKDFVIEQLKFNNEEELIEKWKNFEAHEKVKWSNNFESINLYQSSSEDYLSLPSSVNVQFIDNMDNLEKLFNIWVYNSSKRQIVGLDAEWLPYSYNQPIVGASIMQMAFGNFVFILDAIVLKRIQNLFDLHLNKHNWKIISQI